MSDKKGKPKKDCPDVINVAAAKAKLSQYLARAKRGKETVITEFRVPVAKIVPFAPVDRDFEAIEPKESLSLLKEEVLRPGVKRKWSSLELLLKDREDR